MSERITVLKERLRRRGIRAHLFTHLPNVRYLSGFTGSSGWLLLADDESWFITDGRYRTQAMQEVRGAEVRVAGNRMPQEVAALLRGKAMRSLGVEAANLTLELASLLRHRIGLRLRATRNIVEDMRIRKNPEEIRCLRAAARRAEAAFLDIKEMVCPGVRERDIAVALEAALKRRGSTQLPFDAIVASGPRSALPHARPADRVLQEGDLVVIDWGGECDGYFSDMTRTFCAGAPGGEAKRIYDIVQRAQRAAVKAVAPGVPFRDVDDVARRMIRDAGMGEYFSHGTGHGVGVEIHEAPTLSPRARGTLETGMVVTIEPGIYVPDFGGVRIEDTVLVTDRGCRSLTKLPRRFECLG